MVSLSAPDRCWSMLSATIASILAAPTLTVACALDGTTELKRACQEANQTPAGRARR